MWSYINSYAYQLYCWLWMLPPFVLNSKRPLHTVKIFKILCCDGYGSMLWELQSNPVEQIFKCWNTYVKLAWGMPISTFTYLVVGYFAADEITFCNKSWIGIVFFKKLLLSSSKEVGIHANLVANDPRTTTCLSLRHMRVIISMAKAEFFSSWWIR